MRYFFWNGRRKVEDHCFWLAEHPAPPFGKTLYLMPLDPEDRWGRMGQSTLESEWFEDEDPPKQVVETTKRRIPEIDQRLFDVKVPLQK